MFDLDTEIRAWRRTMHKAVHTSGDGLEELEGHLRDEFDRLVKSDQTPEQAWSAAVARLGTCEQLAAEFNKLPQQGALAWWPARVVLGLYVLLTFVMAGLIMPMLAKEKVTLLLASHVAIVSLGYAAVFAVGALSMWSAAARAAWPWTASDTAALQRTVRGLTIWGLAMTFLGIVLGGIWASGALGQFWGWDPKEVGGLLVLAWQVFTWWVVSRPRHELSTVAVGLAGNMIVTLSWFGPPLLGIGLHAYGHSMSWLVIGFVLLQPALMALAVFVARVRAWNNLTPSGVIRHLRKLIRRRLCGKLAV